MVCCCVQVNFRGQVLGEEYNDGMSYQLLSIAGDGQVLIWDTRYNDPYNHTQTDTTTQTDNGSLTLLKAPHTSKAVLEEYRFVSL